MESPQATHLKTSFTKIAEPVSSRFERPLEKIRIFVHGPMAQPNRGNKDTL